MANYGTPVNQFLKSIDIQPYDRYLPNAFNDSLSILEKINKLIHQLNENAQLTNEVAMKWNTFVDWVNEDGINEPIEAKLNELMKNGTIKELIDNEVMTDITTKLNDISISIKSFGAKGDGITDDSEAFKRAFTSGVGKLYIPEGVYIINITPGTNHNSRNFVGNVNIQHVIGIKGKSIIKLGNGNCNEMNYTGFQALFQWKTNPDFDVIVEGLTIDYNYKQNKPYHYQAQFSGVEPNSQNFAFLPAYIRDFTMRDCEIIGHSGTNVILYRPNNYNTRSPIVKIEHNVFKDIGATSTFIDVNGKELNAYHDHSTVSIHNHESTTDNGNGYKLIAHINHNDFKGIGGNAYNACECGAEIQFFNNNTIDKYYISNLICASRKEVIAKNHNNIGTNLAQGFGIFTYKAESTTPDELAFKLIEIKDNYYNINIDQHKNTPNWSSYTLTGSYYTHGYVGGFWGSRYRNIDTLSIDNNTFEYLISEDVQVINGDTYFGNGLGFAPFLPSDVTRFTKTPTLKNFNVTNNTFKNVYKRALLFATYPDTTNIQIKGNKVYNSGHQPGVNWNMFTIELLGDDPDYPYSVNPLIHAYNESVIFENNYMFDTLANYMLAVNIREKEFNVPISLFQFKNNLTNIPLSSSHYSLSGGATDIATKNSDTFIKNKVSNSNFFNGVQGWSPFDVSVNIVNHQLEITESPTLTEHYVVHTFSNPIVGHKYYIRSNVQKNGGMLVIYNKTSDGSFEQIGLNPVIKTGVSSGIFSPTSLSPTPSFFMRLYGKMGTYLGQELKYYFNNCICVDLTEIYGSGFEPSKSWCDANININTVAAK